MGKPLPPYVIKKPLCQVCPHAKKYWSSGISRFEVVCNEQDCYDSVILSKVVKPTPITRVFPLSPTVSLLASDESISSTPDE